MTAHDHPHARGEDEVFSLMFGAYTLNVDEARRLIAAGFISVMDYAMPVRRAGETLLALHEYGFSRDGRPIAIPATATAIDFDRLASIPGEAMEKPALMVMWSPSGAETGADTGDAFPVLIDGNHRLAKRWMTGETGTMPCLLIRNWDDIARFAYDRSGRRLSDPPFAAPRR